MDEIDFLETLIEHEELVAELYRQLRVRNPDHAEFWYKMVQEETAHASLVRSLLVELRNGRVSLQAKRFPKSEIQFHNEFVRKQIDFGSDMPVDTHTAFRAAVRVENSMIEKHFFRVFDTDSPDVARVLRILEEQTEGHLQTLEKRAYKALRKRGLLSSLLG